MESPAIDSPPDAFRGSSSYQAASEFLFGRINYERAPRMPYTRRDMNLRRMRRLLELLDEPQQSVRAVHVAGTKGKGSTTALLSSTLTAAGYRCGAYTSPHLHQVEERFAVDGHGCSPQAFVELIDRVRPAVLRMDRESSDRGPTYFEITTAMAFEHFRREAVDVAVMEVGLGGRLDATNLCHPLVSVVTSISYDHTRQLGNTLTSIATEKAGIFKPGVPAVSGAQDPESRASIAARAREQGSPLRELGVDFRFDYVIPDEAELGTAGRLSFDWRGEVGWQRVLEDVPLGLLGKHQAANGAVAFAALRELPPDLAVDEASVRLGFAAARSPGRIEIARHKPLTIVDAAHNVASAEALVATLRECFPQRTRALLLATTTGKDVDGMLRALLPAFDRLVCTRYLNNPRAFDPARLYQRAMELSGECGAPCRGRIDLAEDPRSAWRMLCDAEDPAALLCASGSFFIAAEIRDLISTPAAGVLRVG